MPKRRTNEFVQCQYFGWILSVRKGIFYADGRSNPQKLNRYSLGVTTRAEALEALRQLDLYQAVEHCLVSRTSLQEMPATVSLQEGIRKYLANVEGERAMENVSDKTLKRYRAVFDKFSNFCRDHQLLGWHQVNHHVLKQYAVWLKEEKYAYATRYLELTTIKQVVKYLIDVGDLPESNRIRYKFPKLEDTDTYCFTCEEVGAILDLCWETPNLRWFHAVLFALTHTGMRISELASLRWSDIDFEKNVIWLTDERHRRSSQRTEEARQLKGKRSRSFPIHQGLRPILQGLSRETDGRVFHDPDGDLLKPDNIRRLLVNHVLPPLASRFPTPPGEVRGFIDGRIHSFRHYFCSMCANARVAEQTLMSWLGHRNSRMIRRYYHLHDAVSQQAMQQVQFVSADED